MKKSQKKEDIINTAEKLFYQHGFHAIGVKNILEQAGVATMTMYYHFKSKEDLIKEVLVQREKHYFQFLETKIDRGNDINQYVESIIKAHLDWIKTDDYNGCLFLRAKQEYEGVNDKISSVSREHKKRFLNKIENDLKLLHAEQSLSVQISIILEGITSMAQILELDKVKDTAIDLAKSIEVAE
ncbi:TetR/AcrR family transcriptional regulator [Sediminibacillus albus]|uniref:DNA-binding transcriptional regulator, AcrR family n=1 Tax=Sediminibacillus albus TaxID=407036 RepID=A0A1G9AI02_9BACI|nr:TetR/AcrR family transcriptional regulator [Sediminibacillus albus]SDK26972.1 DNA-binding transcriptional regulator, AcrR family [Sediminibacillus albus]